MSRSGFPSVVRRPVSLDARRLVQLSHSSDRTSPPVTVEPLVDGLDLVDWSVANRAAIDRELRALGCVLFRGFRIHSAAAFERIARTLCSELYTEYGDLPGAAPGAKVYGSTPYPPDRTILFHNESSHLSSWPKTMCFCCIRPADEGGETPVADSREVYQRLDAAIRDEFERKGLLYIRNFVPGLDVSWRTFFRTDDRAVVEAYCRDAGMTCEWWGSDALRTIQQRPAIVRHPDTGEPLFFNQVLLHHVSSLDPASRETLCAEFSQDQLPRSVYFGDRSPIPDAAIAHVGACLDAASRAFAWQAGDVLLVDNMRMAHSRNPYKGQRSILVAMGDMLTSR